MSHNTHIQALPNPDKIILEDVALLKIYKDFHSRLSSKSDPTVIQSDGDLFSFHYNDGGIDPKDFGKLRLLTAFLRPTKKLIIDLENRVREWFNSFGTHSSLVESSILEALKEIERFQRTSDYGELIKETQKRQNLDSLNSLFSNAPGMDWQSKVDIDTWTKSWVIVFHYGDSDDDIVNIFPTVLGFVARSNYLISAANLLAAEPLYTTPSQAEISGNDLLVACWVRHGEEQLESIGQTLLEFDEETRGILTQEYGTLASSSLFDDIREVECFSEDCLDSDNINSSLEMVFKKYGDIKSNNGMKPLLKILKQEEDRIDIDRDKAWEEEYAKRKAAKKARYDAAEMLRPQDLPEKTTLDQLTKDQQLSLEKWMKEELKFIDCSLTYCEASRWGHSLGYYYFSIHFTSPDGDKHKSFREPFPTVMEAFEIMLES